VAVRILLEMDEHGAFSSRMREPGKARSPLFLAQVPAFLEFLARSRDVGSRTVRRREYQLLCFTDFLTRRRVSKWELVTVRQARDFLERLAVSAQTRCAYAQCLREFFRWAFLRGVRPVDSSPAIPTVRHYRLARLPSLLSAEEVKRLLRSLDRSTIMGRRDYAVMLLAARYGMRPSDIRQLSLDHIDWLHRRIVFEQSKTRRELALPLLRDVGAALRDYIRHGRPRTSSRTVFVRHKAPFVPFCEANTLNQVMRGALARAGLPRNRKGGSGLSLFRHTLATHLLSSGRPLKIIGDILGHVTAESTLIYAKVDLSNLRTAAISMREVMA
jgi:integrase/recombinase XerD